MRLDALYTGEMWRNARGGRRVGWKYLGDLDLAAELDAERAWGVEGATLFANALFIHGGSLSDRLIGDAQTASNIEAARQVRLYELWIEKRFGNAGNHSVRLGLYDLNSEFDASDVSSLFVNSSHGVGPQLAQTGLNGPSIFPVTSLGMRLRLDISPAWVAQMAVLDGVPGDPDRPTSNAIRVSSDDGLLIVAEASGLGDRGRKLSVGAWTYTARFDEIAVADSEAAVSRRRGSRGLYVLLEGQLYPEGSSPEQGLSAFLRVGTANGRFNRFDEYIGGGFVYTGLLPQRPDDQFGIALASVANGREYRLANESAGVVMDEREDALELSYRFPLNGWLTLQGVLLHVVNPDTDPALADATAVALRFELTTGFKH
jgi:porin